MFCITSVITQPFWLVGEPITLKADERGSRLWVHGIDDLLHSKLDSFFFAVVLVHEHSHLVDFDQSFSPGGLDLRSRTTQPNTSTRRSQTSRAPRKLKRPRRFQLVQGIKSVNERPMVWEPGKARRVGGGRFHRLGPGSDRLRDRERHGETGNAAGLRVWCEHVGSRGSPCFCARGPLCSRSELEREKPP